MSVKDCVEKVNKAMKGTSLSKRDVEALLNELEKEAEKIMGADNDYADSIREVGKKFNDFLARQAREQKRRSLLQVKSRQTMMSKIDRLIEQGVEPNQAFMSVMVGMRLDGVKGARDSTAARQLALTNKLTNNFTKHLQKENLIDVFRSKDESVHLAILDALEALNTEGAPKPDGKIGRIAEIYNIHLKRMRERLRRAGVDTRDLDGYTMAQTHDQALIKIAAEDEWKDFVRDKIDYNKVFGTEKYSAADVEAFLKNTYQALSTGVRKNGRRVSDIAYGKDAETGEVRVTRPANMAERLSQSRVIHFKDTESFFQYNQRFGKGSVQETLVGALWRGGQNIALLEDWGPNPRSNFDEILKRFRQRYRDDAKILSKLDDRGFKAKISGSDLEALFKNIDGTAFIAENPNAARIMQNIRGGVAMAKLGGATISAVSDIPIIAETLANNSVNMGEGYMRAFSHAINRLPEGDRMAFASMIDTYQENAVGSLANRFGLFDEQPGGMQEAMRIFYKLNGLEWWTNMHKEGVSAALSHNLAMNKSRSFLELEDPLRNQLEQFDITEAEWDLIRKAESIKGESGKEFITDEVIDNISDEDIARQLGELGVKPENISKYREALSDKLSSYFIETVNDAVITPGARERAIQNFGYQPGSVMGEFVRTSMLFKSFPATFMTNILAPAFKSARNGDVKHLAHIIIGMTMFGGVAMAAKMTLRGYDVMELLERAKEDKGIATGLGMAMLVQGGGLGIFGDFVFGGQNRYGTSLSETLAGPVWGDLISAVGSAPGNTLDLARGELTWEQFSAKALGATRQYIPGQNLPYARPFLDLLVYESQEALNPGYLRRMENRLERERGLTFMTEPIDLRPSSMVD